MDIQFVAPGAGVPAKAAVVRIVFEGDTHEGAIGQAVAASRFTGGKGQTLDILAPQGLDAARLVLVGAGKRDGFDAVGAEHAAATGYNAVKASGLELLRIEGAAGADLAARAALGVRLASYRFDKYRTKEPAEKKPSVVKTEVATPDADAALAAFAPLAALADAISFTRDLVSEPPNVLYPAEFAARVKALETLGLEVEILGEVEMKALGMGALLAVGQGSIRESQLAVIRWNGAADKSAQPIAFVGKGVCFDTGGISIKPAENMEDMKWDMGGAAAVAGVMHVLAGRKAKVNAVGILGLVENMPDGNSYRPGDVLTSMSGQTIEVVNTDAEGRLVLADALWYCQDRFKPKFMVDLATLTGAIIIAIGNDLAGCYANDEDLAAGLLAASKAEDEGLWRMPLPEAYNKQIDSMIADMKNTGGRPGGSITAALFLQKYVNGTPWAHLDIASTAWKKPSSIPTSPDGATGFGVRLLNRMVQDKYEG
ncbi:MAG: leucyl aminopeptidase [Phenylobacterium sp. RIFCSPHIGHO2_01_FULL_69_31]|uniref:leucyl aminopeptidase n=1 Tax=Phenylobacterium sp. RIFCSPHIGHO2_01_FULL_69_31 TaxID=1801944 RepID=UPI0008D5015D|nr:leucyl aminopeptidase [Phenylobacterium sp. RIFCSPHIGHO2_01_FULL_69_31]OHB27087.1 MAG: leucyl aminopeptidase [Phenylobacterium sp. RIFCSPHIGHO2_01_FULL_69_31]